MSNRLPVHGFVLAGGKSTRMGEDKALMPFCGTPLIELAVEKLGAFCAEVGIAGNREDLASYGAVVQELRLEWGPAAGIEAALMAAQLPWVLCIPVDVPLVPAEVLRRWVERVIGAEDEVLDGSYLVAEGQPQPTFCLLRRECLALWSGMLETGERRLTSLLRQIEVRGRGSVRPFDVEGVAGCAGFEVTLIAQWFWNLNTPLEMAAAEALVVGTERDRNAHGGTRCDG